MESTPWYLEARLYRFDPASGHPINVYKEPLELTQTDVNHLMSIDLINRYIGTIMGWAISPRREATADEARVLAMLFRHKELALSAREASDLINSMTVFE